MWLKYTWNRDEVDYTKKLMEFVGTMNNSMLIFVQQILVAY